MTVAYTLFPTPCFPALLGEGFCLHRAVEILHTYGGFVNVPVAEADVTAERVDEDFRRNLQAGPTALEYFYSNPYTAFDTFSEVLCYVTVTTDILLQATHNLPNYLRLRDEARHRLLSLLSGVFGLDVSHRNRIDEQLVAASQLYAPDLAAGAAKFALTIRGKVRSDHTLFSRSALAYTISAHSHVFGRMLLYDKAWLGLYVTTCPECRAVIRVFDIRPPTNLRCRSCGRSTRIEAVQRSFP